MRRVRAREALLRRAGRCRRARGNGLRRPPGECSLVPIGAGLEGQKGLHASVYARGIPRMSAFAFDCAGRLWVTRSGATAHGADGVYVVRRAGAAPAKVISGIRGTLGLAWLQGRWYVSTHDGVVRFDRLRGDRFLRRTMILRCPVAGTENNNLVVAPDGRLVLGVSAPCDHCKPSAALLRRNRVVPPRRQRPPHRRDTRTGGLRTRIFGRRAVREHEPARRSRRQDSRRLARRCQGR